MQQIWDKWLSKLKIIKAILNLFFSAYSLIVLKCSLKDLRKFLFQVIEMYLNYLHELA